MNKNLLMNFGAMLIVVIIIIAVGALILAKQGEAIYDECCRQYGGEIKMAENQSECHFLNCHKCFVSGNEIKEFTYCNISLASKILLK